MGRRPGVTTAEAIEDARDGAALYNAGWSWLVVARVCGYQDGHSACRTVRRLAARHGFNVNVRPRGYPGGGWDEYVTTELKE